jgi:hypothetical protein
MVWLTYRQHRLELSGLLLGAAALAGTLLIVVQLALAVRSEVGLDQCGPGPFTEGRCIFALQEYSRRIAPFTGFLLSLFVFPALAAAFVGGPLLAREFERGTHRLAWTQGITREQWTLRKVGLVLAVAALAGLIIAAVGDEARGLMTGRGGSPFSAFDFTLPAIVVYMVFAIALGVAMGALIRRSVGAMFASLIGFVGVRAFVETQLRPHFQPPIASLNGAAPEDAWNLGIHYLSANGTDVPAGRVSDLIINFGGTVAQQFRGNMNAYFAANDVFATQLYQPADRYWLFQSIETAIFLSLSLALVLFTIWLVRRRA